MHGSYRLGDLLVAVAPGALCQECIGDRVPILWSRRVAAMVEDLKPPHFERSTGECVGCRQRKPVIRHV